ncbi:MAG: 2-(1,2-epoxy-1,2-dihydrophenyl)acetyl-CoA isomerase PaaG [Pseudomonadota bacterium]
MSVLLFSVDQGIARVTLNRPDKLNSFNDEMKQSMKDCLEQIGNDKSVRVMLLSGSGRGFCAGQDLADRQLGDDQRLDLGETLEASYNHYIRKIRDFNFPVVCAVNGVAAGAGANLALCCDLVLAKKSSKFIQAFCKIGLVPDCGGTWVLPRLVGQARAMGLSMLGTPVSAEEAERIGMIWRCVEDENFESEVEALVQHLAVQPTKGLALTKQAIRASLSNSFDDQLEVERQAQREAGFSDDFREGVQAFFDKRDPRFCGS